MYLTIPETVQECERGIINLGNDEQNSESNDDWINICTFSSGGADDIERINKFWINLGETTAFRKVAHFVKIIFLGNLCLDNWEPFLRALQECGANVEKLELVDCQLTERGALLLGQIFKLSRLPSSNININNDTMTNSTNESIQSGSFCIKTFNAIELEGSTAWMNGFLQNKTITHLDLDDMLVPFKVIHFIQNSSQIEVAVICQLINDQEQELERFNVDENHDNHQGKCTNLERLDISFGEDPLTLSELQSIGRVLRRATNLKDLKLCALDGSSLNRYDLFKDAIHCNRLTLQKVDFDPHIVSSLITGDTRTGHGKLKYLRLERVASVSRAKTFLGLLDLSLLDAFEISCDKLMNVIFRQLAENKGPKQLSIWSHLVLDNFATQLASSLTGNNKIQRLEIHAEKLAYDLVAQRRLVDAMGTMPRLQSWEVTRLSGSIPKQPEWTKWIVHQLESNWNIHEIRVPFQLGEDIQDMLALNKHWRPLFRSHDGLSGGVWAPALSRINRASLMFLVLREMPILFQQVADAASRQETYRLPRFIVPHHPECPGCRKREECIPVQA